MLVINSIQFFFSELFPGFKTTPLTLEEVFGAPGMREISLGSGAAAVSERSELLESNYPFHRFCAFRQLQFRRQNYKKRTLIWALKCLIIRKIYFCSQEYRLHAIRQKWWECLRNCPR